MTGPAASDVSRFGRPDGAGAVCWNGCSSLFAPGLTMMGGCAARFRPEARRWRRGDDIHDYGK